MRQALRTITVIALLAMTLTIIGSTAYANPAPVHTQATCDTITVTIGEQIPPPQIPTLYVVKVAVADGDRTWELGDGDVLEVDREWPGSAWAVWVHGDLHSSGERDDSCEWNYDIVVDTDQPVDVTIPRIIFDEKSHPAEGIEYPVIPQGTPTPAGIRWF